MQSLCRRSRRTRQLRLPPADVVRDGRTRQPLGRLPQERVHLRHRGRSNRDFADWCGEYIILV